VTQSVEETWNRAPDAAIAVLHRIKSNRSHGTYAWTRVTYTQLFDKIRQPTALTR